MCGRCRFDECLMCCCVCCLFYSITCKYMRERTHTRTHTSTCGTLLRSCLGLGGSWWGKGGGITGVRDARFGDVDAELSVGCLWKHCQQFHSANEHVCVCVCVVNASDLFVVSLGIFTNRYQKNVQVESGELWVRCRATHMLVDCANYWDFVTINVPALRFDGPAQWIAVDGRK